MSESYIAHINEATKEQQTIKEHCENTADLCRVFAIPELKDFMYAVGLAHDIGKYQKSFQRRIAGENIRVEHSTCGALAVKEKYVYPLSLMMEYCIVGHHSGIPNGGALNDTDDMSTLNGRMKRTFESYDKYREELTFPEFDINKWMQFIIKDCGNDSDCLIDKFAFITRYSYSCLVDADSKDTADFCKEKELPRLLSADFRSCLNRVNARILSFNGKTSLQKARTNLQSQAFQNAHQKAEIYLMNMPTGSGKTLASVKIALEKVIAYEKKRIIYVIPYNSIIDQTADVFKDIFGNDMEILRHQSTFSYEDETNGSEDYREASKCAAENWQAPFIITTAVQFFESVYSNKRGKLRKMHNMADSILIFDEAHLMPRDYLQPCLQSIAYITRYLNSEAIFLTATMPDFERLVREYALPDSKIINLITDTKAFSEFSKCKFQYLGELQDEEILQKCSESPSSLVIVNKKKTARRLFEKCKGRKYHLSTYMTAFDRRRVLRKIREELITLEKDYPSMDVPEDRRIAIFSTSLIEAGVDLDVYTVFRETAGLDSILQAGGRCNREGKRSSADVYVFDYADESRKVSENTEGNLAKGLLMRYQDISVPECVKEYYDRLLFMNEDEIQSHAIHNECCDLRSIPFQSYAENFELIENKTASLVVARDEKSRALVDTLKYTKQINTRKLQGYACTLYKRELDDLIRQHVVDDFGTGVYCLTNQDYYDEEIGIKFDAIDYFV